MFVSRPALILTALACGANQFITYGLINFAVLFLMREKHMTLHQVAIYYALVVAIGLGGGILASGPVIDRFTQRSKRAYALVPAATLALALPFYLAFVWAPAWPMALLFLTGTMFLNYFYLTSAVTLVQEEVRPDQRVMSGALLLLIMNLIGLGLGPTFVGAASDFFRASHPLHSLQRALYMLAPSYVVAISLFLALARVLRKENLHVGETIA
jgi:MFS family permease